MEPKEEIEILDHVKLLVNDFYGKIREDDLLKEIFNNVIEDKWPQHLEKMYSFWQTVLLDQHTYHGSPFLQHVNLPVEKEHFNRWLKLFEETVDEHFTGVNAEKAKWQGHRMAEMFQHKIEYYRTHPVKPI